jgi:glycogen synthase
MQKEFSWRAAASRYVELYQALVKRKEQLSAVLERL